MSLDVSLRRKRPDKTEAAQAAKVLRDNGFDLFAQEIEARHDTSEYDGLYDSNITHNLMKMAREAGIYLACWSPGEMLAPDIAKKMQEQADVGNYHGPGGELELEKTLPVAHARDLIGPLRAGLELLRSDPERFKKFNAPNGWGLYEHFVPWVAEYLAACEENPDAEVHVCR
jgi:hypothetical protein